MNLALLYHVVENQSAKKCATLPHLIQMVRLAVVFLLNYEIFRLL